MTKNQTAIAVGVAGLAFAWWSARKQSGLLAQILRGVSNNPAPLASTPIGVGYIDPITGGTGRLPVQIDRHTGDVSAPLGVDVALHAIDPWDPNLPNVHPVNGGLIDDARADLPDDTLPTDLNDSSYLPINGVWTE